RGLSTRQDLAAGSFPLVEHIPSCGPHTCSHTEPGRHDPRCVCDTSIDDGEKAPSLRLLVNSPRHGPRPPGPVPKKCRQPALDQARFHGREPQPLEVPAEAASTHVVAEVGVLRAQQYEGLLPATRSTS